MGLVRLRDMLCLPRCTRDIARIACLFIAASLISTTVDATTTLPPRFVGYWNSSSSWEPVNCEHGLEYTSSDERVKCCDPQSACYFVVACSNDTLSYANNELVTCGPSRNCVTQTVFDSLEESSSALHIACGSTLVASTFYRNTTTPASATITISIHSRTAAPSQWITAPSPTAIATKPSPTAIATKPSPTAIATEPASTTPVTEPAPSPRDSGSQAWIAGAVIGPVAGCAILAGLGFWFFRRRHAKPRDEVAAPTAAAGAYPPKSSGDGPAELPASKERPISELPGSFGQFLGERPLSELEAP